MRKIDTPNRERSANERFQAIYDAYASDVAGYALRRRGGADAADAVAETFVVAWNRLDQIPDEPATRAWLLGQTRRIINAQTRGQQRQEQLADRLAEQFEARYGAVAPVDRLEQVSLVGAAIQRLSDDDRELLLLVAWEDLQPAEIGILLGLSGPVVRKRLQRARNRLRRHMADLEVTWRGHAPAARQRRPIRLHPNAGGMR